MRWRRWGLVGVFLTGGCDDGGATADPLDGDAGDMRAADAAAPDAASLDAAPHDAATRDAAPLDATRPDAAPGDAAVEDAALPDAGPIVCDEDAPVLRRVRFRVNNSAATPRYLPIRGDLCELFAINDGRDVRVPSRVVNICTADCACIAGTPESWATAYRRVAPGETYEFTWAAQYTDRCERAVYCPEFEGRGRDPRFTVARPVRRNLQPGQFALLLAFEPDLPAGCVDDGAAEIECMGPIAMRWFDLCEAQGTIEVPFEVTVEDESVVEVELP